MEWKVVEEQKVIWSLFKGHRILTCIPSKAGMALALIAHGSCLCLSTYNPQMRNLLCPLQDRQYPESSHSFPLLIFHVLPNECFGVYAYLLSDSSNY